MKQNRRWLVVVQAEYVDGVAYVSEPDAEMGGENWHEIDPTEIVVGSFDAPTKKEGIQKGAEYWQCNPDVLDAYRIPTKS